MFPNACFKSLGTFTAHLKTAPLETCHSTGDWSIGQILFHLAAAFELSSEPSNATFPMWRRWLLTPLTPFVGWLSIPKGIAIPPALADRLAPPDGVDPEAQRARLLRAIKQFQDHTGPWPDHPIFGRMTKSSWTRFHLKHTAHHLQTFMPA